MQRIGLIVLLVAILTVTARAWDDGGHEVVAAIAYAHLDAKAKQAVERLAGQVHGSRGNYDAVTIACWMDDIRRDPAVPNDRKFQSWHYIDIPIDPRDPMPSFAPGSDNQVHGNAVQALKRALVVLKGGADPYITDQPTALAMMEHLVGDIHQPLHCATKYFVSQGKERDDHGGNLELVINGPPGMDKFNLHAFWDMAYRASFDASTGCVQMEGFTLDTAALGDFENALHSQGAPNPQWLDTDFDLWARTGNSIARDFVYAGITETSNFKLCRLSSVYVEKARTMARAQIAAAGLRLAQILNDTLGADAPPSVPPSYPAGPPAVAY